MADDPGNGSPQELWCPSCLTLVGDAPTCTNCGLPQTGESAARLRVVVARIHDANDERNALAVELQVLHDERAGLLHALQHPNRAAVPARSDDTDERGWSPAPAPARGDWRPERVR